MYLEREAQGLREHICKVRQHYQLKGYNALKIHKCPCLQHSLVHQYNFVLQILGLQSRKEFCY